MRCFMVPPSARSPFIFQLQPEVSWRHRCFTHNTCEPMFKRLVPFSRLYCGWLGINDRGSGSSRGNAHALCVEGRTSITANEITRVRYGHLKYNTVITHHILYSGELPVYHFSCDQAALRMVFYVRLSVCPSVRLSVCPSVTPFWLCSHHGIIMKFSFHQGPG